MYCPKCNNYVLTDAERNCIDCGSPCMTEQQMLFDLIYRVKKLEGISDQVQIEEKDVNEFGKSGEQGIVSITVSPSNFEKLNNVGEGNNFKVFCTDNRSRSLICKVCEVEEICVDSSQVEEAASQPKLKTARKKRRRKRTKNKKAPKTQQVRKNSKIVGVRKDDGTKFERVEMYYGNQTYCPGHKNPKCHSYEI